MNLRLTKNRIIAALFTLTILVPAAVPFLTQTADAATLTNTYVRLSRLSTGATSPVRLVFKTVGAGATSASINFSGAWTTNSGVVNATQTISSASCAADTGATALPGGSLAASGSGSTISITSITALSATTAYCVDLTSASAVTNPTAGTYTATVTVGSDSTNVGLDILASNLDQIGVTATVNPSFTFSLSSNAAALGVLTTAGPTASSTINATVSTNALTGWQMWGADTTASDGLHSTTASKTINYTPAAGGTVGTLAANTEGYNLSAGTATGTTCTGVTTDAKFASGGTAYKGGGLDGTLRSLAAATGVANACALPLNVNASISGTTPPASDYADTITVVAAGIF